MGASMAAPHHLHSTQYSTSLAGPPSLGWNVTNLGVDTIQPQLGDSLAAPGVAMGSFVPEHKDHSIVLNP